MSPKLEFELADNALDYVLSAAEHAKSESARDIKYAILHLFAGVELILKARLFFSDWKLLFADTSKANKKLLETGGFRSVDFETAWDRLTKDVGLALEATDFDHLDRLRKLRNKVQHFRVVIETAQARSLLAIAGNFVIEFLKQQLSSLESSHGAILTEIHEHLRDFEQFVSERLKAIEDNLAAAAIKIECPRCWQESLAIGDYDNPTCLFCGGVFDPEALAEDSETAQSERCPECGREAAAVRFAGDDMVWFCLACGEEGDYRKCPRCDQLMTQGEGPCSACMSEYLSRDD